MPITSLNRNDVLIGRGTGPNTYIGNKRFRQYVDTRRAEYQGTPSKDEKARIAQQVVDHIHSLGGRFVVQVSRGTKVNELLVNGEWRETECSVAIEKAKQSLRERKKPSKESKKKEKEVAPSEQSTSRTEGIPIESEQVQVVSPSPLEGESNLPSFPLAPTSPFLSSLPTNTVTTAWNPLLAPTLLGNIQHPDVDAHLLLFQSALGLLPPPQPLVTTSSLLPLQLGHFGSLPSAGNSGLTQRVLPEQYLAASGLREGHNTSLASNVASADNGANDACIDDDSPTECTSSYMHDVPLSTSEQASKEDEAAAFVLSSLSIKDRPVITYEQWEQEKASLSDEARASALADMFGKMNIGTDDAPSSKKAKRDLDRESIDFLILHMRFHIAKIPENKKTALTEAQRKCRVEEFSDARLEKFLRCEGMNAELAAQRFVGYWEKRKEAFGKDKFTLRLTLSEALRDDIAALEAAAYSLLPRRDLSGRQIIYMTPSHKNKSELYNTDSLFRAMWYVAEVAAKDNMDARSGIVEVAWLRDFSLWDYDSRTGDRLVTHLRCYWPVRTIASHVCCPPRVFVRWLFPILNALVDPFVRSRIQVHDVPPTEIMDALSEYGIQREMLPTEMGGTVELDRSEWIAQRRAAEMEEL